MFNVDDFIEGESIKQCKYCANYMTCVFCSGADGYCEQWEDRLAEFEQERQINENKMHRTS